MQTPDEDTLLEIALASGFEDAAWLPADRLPHPIPAQRFMVALAELSGGAEREINIGGYRDRVKLALESAIGQKSVSFSYRDETPGTPGDYYYFEVVLQDGSTALTSPRIVRAVTPQGQAIRYLVPEQTE